MVGLGRVKALQHGYRQEHGGDAVTVEVVGFLGVPVDLAYEGDAAARHRVDVCVLDVDLDDETCPVEAYDLVGGQRVVAVGEADTGEHGVFHVGVRQRDGHGVRDVVAVLVDHLRRADDGPWRQVFDDHDGLGSLVGDNLGRIGHGVNGGRYGRIGFHVEYGLAVHDVDGRCRQGGCRARVELDKRVVGRHHDGQVLGGHLVVDAVLENQVDFGEAGRVDVDGVDREFQVALLGRLRDGVDFDIASHDVAGAVVLVLGLQVGKVVMPGDPFDVVVAVGEGRVDLERDGVGLPRHERHDADGFRVLLDIVKEAGGRDPGRGGISSERVFLLDGVEGRDERLVKGELDVPADLRTVFGRVVGSVAVDVFAMVVGGDVRRVRECEFLFPVDRFDIHRGIGLFLVLRPAGQVDTLELHGVFRVGMGPERPAVLKTAVRGVDLELEEVAARYGEFSFDVDLRVVAAFRSALRGDRRVGDGCLERHVGPADGLSCTVPDGAVVAGSGDGDREVEPQIEVLVIHRVPVRHYDEERVALLPVGAARAPVLVQRLYVNVHFDHRGVLFGGERVFGGFCGSRGNGEIVSGAGIESGEFRFVEEHGAAGGCLALVRGAGCRPVVHDAVGAAAAPPVNLGAAVVHLADGHAADGNRFEGHGEAVPLTVVVILGRVSFGVDSFQVEIVRGARRETLQCQAAVLCRFVLLLAHELGGVGLQRVEDCRQGDFVGVPADDGFRFGNRGTHDVAVQRAFVVGRELCREALRGEQELGREVDAGFGGGVLGPVLDQGEVGGASAHERALGALVLVGHAAGVVAVRVRGTVVRVLGVLVAGTEQERDVPRVCAERVVHVVESHAEVAFVAGQFVHQEHRVRRAEVVADDAPVKGGPDEVVGRNHVQLCRAFVRLALDAGVCQHQGVTVVGTVVDELAERRHDAHGEGVPFDIGHSERAGDFLVAENQLLQGEQHVGVDVLVVGGPSAGAEPADVSEVTGLEVFHVIAGVVRVVVDFRVLVKVVAVGGVAGRVPERECGGCGVVEADARSGVESLETVGALSATDGAAGAVQEGGGDDFCVDFLGCIQEFRGIVRLEYLEALGDVGHGGGEDACRVGADSPCDFTVGAALGGALLVLAFRQIPILVVGVRDTHGVVHVALVDQPVFLRRLVELEQVVRTDFRFVENVGDAVGKYRVGVGFAVAVLGLVLVDEVDHREHVGRVSQRFGYLEVVTAVMPSAG